MSFSYLIGDIEERDYIRFRINDVTEDAGPKPGGQNFSDEELDMILAEEGSWQKVVVACFEALSSAWAPHPSYTADGVSISQGKTTDHWLDLADDWRKIYGLPKGGGGHARAVTKVDGWSQDEPSTRVDDVTY